MTFQMPIAPLSDLLMGSMVTSPDLHGLKAAADAFAARDDRQQAIAMVDAIYAMLDAANR